jgi:hypothetical protein
VLAILDFLLGSVTDNLTVGLAFVLICATVVGISLGLPEEEAADPQEAAGTTVPTAAGRWTTAP